MDDPKCKKCKTVGDYIKFVDWTLDNLDTFYLCKKCSKALNKVMREWLRG